MHATHCVPAHPNPVSHGSAGGATEQHASAAPPQATQVFVLSQLARPLQLAGPVDVGGQHASPTPPQVPHWPAKHCRPVVHWEASEATAQHGSAAPPHAMQAFVLSQFAPTLQLAGPVELGGQHASPTAPQVPH